MAVFESVKGVGIKALAAAALVILPAPTLADTTVPAQKTLMQSDCQKLNIIGPNTGVAKVDFVDRDGKVIESAAGKVKVAILGCDATWFFVNAPSGPKAKVKRLDAMTDGDCKASVVADAVPVNHSTSGGGFC